jgi:membrane-associated phospholipid phosphatase
MDFDTRIFLELNRVFSDPVATFLFSAATALGNGLVLAVLVLPSLYFFDRARFREHALAMVLAVAFSGLVVTVIKIPLDRVRPPEHFATLGQEVHTPLGTPKDRSFPSGHTQTAFGAAIYLSCMYPALSPIFLLLACLAGVSRIAVGVHFPLDVLAGAAIGSLGAVIGFSLNQRRLKKGRLKKNLKREL